MSTKKGRLLEKVVAGLHIGRGLKVETNVLIPTLRDGKRRREIDVLISGSLSGYPMRLAVECKNENKPIGVAYIGGFYEKLQDIGFPHQHGIFVSTSRYTTGALKRAKELGIKTFLFEGLTADGLSEAIAEAIQSVVYLMLDVREFSFIENVPDGGGPPSRQRPPIFQTGDEKKIGIIQDLIWQQWMHGQPDSITGEHELSLPLPETWQERRNDQVIPIHSISAKVQVIGLVLTITGEARQHSLVNTKDQSIEKKNIQVAFDKPDAKVAIHNIYTETELENFLKNEIKSTISVGRIRIPRIRMHTQIGYIY